ncbi:acyl-CoA dehydrogenase/oxidase [Sparassis latifolia]
MRVEEGYQPVPYIEGNPYAADPVLPSLLKRLFPSKVLEEVEGDLERFGNVVLTELRALTGVSHPPRVVQYNQWGQRVDDLQTSEGWRALKSAAHREGMVGIFYERKFREHSRVYGFAKMLLAVGDTQVIFCPISMTDGAARVIELIGTPEMKRDIYPRLISRDPSFAFTAGQWMTERPGGSDVSRTETTAMPIAGPGTPYGPNYRLDGFKWFSSATDSDVSLVLARTGMPEDGSRALSLFLVPLRYPLLREPSAPRPSATSNNIFIHRLKNKVGTQLVPTAELSLAGAEGFLLGKLNEGVRLITPVLNITRVHSSLSSIGNLRKCLAIATAYSTVRKIKSGTQPLSDQPLHVAELAKVSVLYRALVHFVFGAIVLLGKTECGVATQEEELRLRLLTPAIKAFAADKACAAMEECMTALGGEGYMVENGFGTCIQDALVEKIWEGTITVLSLDLVRAASKSKALDAFLVWARTILSSCPASLRGKLREPLEALHAACDDLSQTYKAPIAPLVPRPALFLFSHIASSLYLLEHAIWAHQKSEVSSSSDIEVFRRWVVEGGLSLAVENVRRAKTSPTDRSQMDSEIVYSPSTHAATKQARL